MEKTISLKCDVCGNDQFSTIDETIENLFDAPDDTQVKCSDCGKIFTKEELIGENEYIINANIEDIADEAVKEVEKKLMKSFKKLKLR